LDRGEYQVVTFAPEKGSGDAQLKVRGFTERNAPGRPLLVERKPVGTALDDYEQRSWWLEVKERRRVILEAAGRNLAELRLWTNGSWLVDAEPAREVVAAQPGRPMLVCRLAADLNPGLYLLTAYGGVSQPQAEESAEHPLHFGLGTPSACGGRYWALRHEGKYWVSSVHSGDPTDSVDATAIVTRWGWPNAKEAHERPFRAQVIALAPRQPWVRRANLLETTNAFLRVDRTGKYEVLARGVEARFRIEPFFTSLPPNYTPPDMRGSGSVWDLDAGYYVLTAEPVKK